MKLKGKTGGGDGGYMGEEENEGRFNQSHYMNMQDSQIREKQ